MDLNDIAESFRRGLQEIPLVVIGLALLGGPTLALIIYRLFGAARRMGTSNDGRATAYWVCRDCRSINEMRLGRCYHCGFPRIATREVEILIDRPGYQPVPLVMPVEARSATPAPSAASLTPADATPVASLARAAKDRKSSGGRKSSGKPVMAETSDIEPVAVGPGHEADVASAKAPTKEESGAAVEAES